MNQAVYLAFLDPGDTVLAMDLSHGGHLTHGAPVSHMGRIFRFARYGTDPADEGRIDFDQLRRMAHDVKPKIVLCGYTSYPRDYDYRSSSASPTRSAPLTMADVSHVGGLIAAGVMRNPFDAGFDVVTTTTHKSLRGPRGGMIPVPQDARAADRQVGVPGNAGRAAHERDRGRRDHARQTAEPAFRPTASRCCATRAPRVRAARARRDAGDRRHRQSHAGGRHRRELRHRRTARRGGARRGVDHHQQADHPRRPNPPLRPSGIRLGTPAATTRG